LIAPTTGLPNFSRRRSCAFVSLVRWVMSAASSGRAVMRSSRSPPAKKVFLAEVMTTPAIESFSASSRSMMQAIDVR
jgi:hypothetical protein